MNKRPSPEDYMERIWFDSDAEFQEALDEERAAIAERGSFINQIEIRDDLPLAHFENANGAIMRLDLMELTQALAAIDRHEPTIVTYAAAYYLRKANEALRAAISKGKTCDE